ncbi:phage tail sheath subtilisin-like domain-containing protein [Azospirillum sp. TSH64]|uniref:phage tail sheath subtilisin-like domain-containing protein n=1 Tax=Azospirillum sp. TSH64 TaxID=652740 RepID=UPI000D61A1AD|nr:phage tail sheath subtilisin-like domain-containing protein [Azospirillum sp. TSH64]PWC81245.1 phage tail protein [Azospirillum sp. TSH64]
MSETFLHGVEVIEIDAGPRPIRTVRSAVIGLIGTAPAADVTKFPLNEPVLVAGKRTDAAGIGETGTLPTAIDAIFDQAGAMVVVIRVEEGSGADDAAKHAATISKVIGGVDASTGAYTGVHAFKAAEGALGVTPRILIAPGFTSDRPVVEGVASKNPVVAELEGVADRLRAIIVADGPGTTDAAAIAYTKDFGNRRVYVVDPGVKVWDTATSAFRSEPASARVAGIICRIDNDRGFWWSPSNNEIYGIGGTTRPIDFSLGDVNSRANLLNENNVATIIRENGYRLWGNRTTAMDPKWTFLSVVRTADMIHESMLRAHLWAVDRCITKTYVDDVLEGVREYLRSLKAKGAILGGDAWVDPELNTPTSIADGRIYFDFDFTPPYPAERVSFRSHLVNDYITEIFK